MKAFILFIFISFNCFSQSTVFKIGKFEFDDVAVHVDGSILMTCAFAQLHYNLTNHKSIAESIFCGAGSSLVIGIVCKEFIHDKWLKDGVFSYQDIASDCWGTALGMVIIRCKFDLDEHGLVKRKKSARRSKFNNKKYILG